MARGAIKRSNGQLSGDGMAIAGLILGYISCALTILWFVVGVMFPELEFFNLDTYD